MIAKKKFIINKGSDILVGWGFEIAYSIGRVVATAAGNGDAKMLDMKQWEIQGYTGGMVPEQVSRAKSGMSNTG